MIIKQNDYNIQGKELPKWFAIDFKKVKTVGDIKRLLQQLDIKYLENNIDLIKDLVKEV